MRALRILLPVAAALSCAILIAAAPAPGYTPAAQYCVNGSNTLCSIIPGNIGPDPLLDQKIAYNGIVGAHPTSPANDVQTPFDNLSWQTFIALNWSSANVTAPPSVGLNGTNGPRVWETWARVSKVFGNSKVQANCNVPAGAELFSIASQGNGQPATRNEEFIQAATGDPAIDVKGNWTLYERRVNGVEIAYLKAPQGNKMWDLTGLGGQFAFAQNNTAVNFPSMGLPGPATGAMEIKAAWRILDPAQHSANIKRFYVVRAMVAVAPDLVTGNKQICTLVDLGLVAMHIIQKNSLTNNSLKPQWFWSTFEHVDNAPQARNACDPGQPSQCGYLGQQACAATLPPNPPDYSYFNATYAVMKTNVPPTPSPSGAPYAWNPAPPYAKNYMTVAGPHGAQHIGTQISRCWQIYGLTDKLNTQWRAQLGAVGSVFQNYMLVGTQWGASTTATPNPKVAIGGVPNFLSNSVVETYLQNAADPKNPFNNGSCITCHNSATLIVNNKTPANLSFLPDLVNLLQTRRPPTGKPGHDAFQGPPPVPVKP
jgi:hypothetical protein